MPMLEIRAAFKLFGQTVFSPQNFLSLCAYGSRPYSCVFCTGMSKICDYMSKKLKFSEFTEN